MSKLKTLRTHIRNMGLLKFTRISGERLSRKVFQKSDRYLRSRGIRSTGQGISRSPWITMTFGSWEQASPDRVDARFTEDEKARILSEADKVCRWQFRLLGSEEIRFDNGIDWHSDFKTGYTWPLAYYTDILKTIDSLDYVKKHADIKVPWELSRMQHHIPLGQAYQLSGRKEYYEAFKLQTMDWIEKNPYKLGPNWSCTMDVAIRAVNWTVAAICFKNEIQADRSFSDLLLNHLWQTGKFIESNLECDIYGHGNNHYLANLAGLVFTGLLLRDTVPQGERWLNKGRTGLESEMAYQVNSDGGSFEGSLSYHRLSAEMFLYSAVALRQNGLELSAPTLKRLEKMCEFIRDYTKPGGKAPVIGDADDGRLLILGTFCCEDKRDHRHLLGTAGVFFNREDFLQGAGQEIWEARWLFGKLPSTKEPEVVPAYAAYPETGVYIYRDGTIYLIIRCGPVGSHGKGGHDHNDQLSFELNIHGEDIVIDPGTFVYTADKAQRQLFRSVASHNVPQYSQFEQNTIRNGGMAELFRMESSHAGMCIESGRNPEGYRFEGTMQYEDSGVFLRRCITVNTANRSIEILDVLEGSPVGEQHTGRLHLSKDVSDLRISGNAASMRTAAGTVRITAETSLHPRTCKVSESYGTFYQSVCLEWPLKESSNVTISY